MSIVGFQQLILVLVVLLWGQSSVRYALEGAYGNRFLGAVTIVGVSSLLLLLSYFAPQYLTKAVVAIISMGAVGLCIFFVL